MKPREWWAKFYGDGNIGPLCTAPGYPAQIHTSLHPERFEERRLIEWPADAPLPDVPEPVRHVTFASNLQFSVSSDIPPDTVEFRQNGRLIGRFKVEP